MNISIEKVHIQQYSAWISFSWQLTVTALVFITSKSILQYLTPEIIQDLIWFTQNEAIWLLAFVLVLFLISISQPPSPQSSTSPDVAPSAPSAPLHRKSMLIIAVFTILVFFMAVALLTISLFFQIWTLTLSLAICWGFLMYLVDQMASF